MNFQKTTKRLSLKPLVKKDTDSLWENFYQDYEDYKFFRYEKYNSKKELEKDIERNIERMKNNLDYSWSITLKNSEEMIGFINIHHLDFKNENTKIGYFIFKNFRHNGYALESVNEIIQFIFQELHLHKIIATTITLNESSNKTLLKAGFTLEGTKKEDHKIANKFYDSNIFGILNKK